MVDICNGYTWG